MSIVLARWVVVASGVWLIFVSGVMLARPGTALRYLGQMASTNVINYSEISLRLIWGLALIWYADLSKFPEFIRFVGLLLVGTSVALFLVPRKWHATYAAYWSKKLTMPLVRIFAPASLLFGIFLIWAVM